MIAGRYDKATLSEFEFTLNRAEVVDILLEAVHALHDSETGVSVVNASEYDVSVINGLGDGRMSFVFRRKDEPATVAS